METNQEQQLEQNQFEGLIEGLINQNYGCSDDFITASTVIGLRNNILKLSKSGEMKSAGLGKERDFHEDKKVRGDKIKWIEEKNMVLRREEMVLVFFSDWKAFLPN